MPWYLNILERTDVAAFSKYLANNAGHDWKRIMPQLLRIRQVQLKNDQILGTWQARTPEGRIAEILASFGHGRTRKGHNLDGTSYDVELDQFSKDIQQALGRWLTTVIEPAVAATDQVVSDVRDPRYQETVATNLARNRAIAPLGPITNNRSVDLMLLAMGSVADTYDRDLEDFYVQFRRYAAQQAAKQYEEQVAAQDEARLDKTAAKTIKSMRDHQKMKLDGAGLKGAHESGKFWLLGRAIDGMPILLVSSKEEKAIDGTYISQAGGLASGSNPGMCTGTFSQDKKAGRIFFILEQGQTQKPVLVSALSSMGVKRDSVFLLPAGGSA